MLEIHTKEQLKQLISQNQVVVVDVWASWCNPCKILAPKFEELSKQYQSAGIVFAKSESDKGVFDDIKGLPSIFFFVRGNPYHTVLGADMNEIKQVLQKLFPQVKQQALQTEALPTINKPQVGYNVKSGSKGKGGYRSYGNL